MKKNSRKLFEKFWDFWKIFATSFSFKAMNLFVFINHIMKQRFSWKVIQFNLIQKYFNQAVKSEKYDFEIVKNLILN